MSGPLPTDVIADLVARFDLHRGSYLGHSYGEAQVRREFVDPLFEALGWDVQNRHGRPEPLKDVIHEASVRVEGAPKAPDYSFRVGGERRFFVETKRPSVNIKNDPAPAFQLRRYGWSAALPVSILTDFQEFAVYDCRVQPRREDKASTARLLFLTFDEYLDRWDEVLSCFTRDAVAQGSLLGLVPADAPVRGKEEVDSVFLKELESWRRRLASELALRNRQLTEKELNYLVQVSIDRLVFLRIAEDRGIEEYGRLKDAASRPDVYPRLLQLFTEADDKYNSGLFYFRREPGRDEEPDGLSPSVSIGDEVLKPIIGGLYYPESPYEFSVLPSDILGQVYERFLGSKVQLSDRGEVTVEQKPEVRKAGGVYYTPTFIVSYLMQRTLGRRLEGMRPDDVSALRILDPACGSGHFLVYALQHLLDWHLNWYTSEGVKYKKYRDRVREGGDGTLRLTTAEKKRILLNNIYGVDIDTQAVEVTKLSLLIKVLENETAESVEAQFKLFAERALPDLGNNIRCGNSLVESDYYAGEQLSLIGSDELEAINPFDWDKEFPEVMGRARGFDIVIGNPPYLSYSGRQAVSIPDRLREYFENKYSTRGWLTAHGLFLERAASRLSKSMIGFIVPDQVGHLSGYGPVRKVLTQHSAVLEIKYWGEGVFEGVETPSMTVIAEKAFQGQTSVLAEDPARSGSKRFDGDEPWVVQPGGDLLEKLRERAYSLGKLVQDPGVHTGNCAKKLILPLGAAPNGAVPVLEGKQVQRYSCEPPKKALRLDYRPEDGEYFRIRPAEKYERAKFVIRQTANRPIVGPRQSAVYFRNSLLALYEPEGEVDVHFIVGLLNSKVMHWAYVMMVHESGQKTFPQVKVGSLRDLPIRQLDLTDPEDVASHAHIVDLVRRRLALGQEVGTKALPHDRRTLTRAIEAVEGQIDEAVYELYGLGPEEKVQVEETLRELQ